MSSIRNGAIGTIPPTSDEYPTGFRASIHGASLADLVQMECLSGATNGFRVASASNVGYLYFESGRLVHAASGSLVGDRAAIEILRWRSGTFSPWKLPPPSPTVTAGWQNLLLAAAQESDEANRGTVVAFPTDRIAAEPDEEPVELADDDVTLTHEAEESVVNEQDTGESLVECAVRLDAEGNVITNRGASEEFTGTVAYTAQLAQLVAQHLGLEPLTALESTGPKGSLFVAVEPSGNVVAARANPGSDLAPLRKKVGL